MSKLLYQRTKRRTPSYGTVKLFIAAISLRPIDTISIDECEHERDRLLAPRHFEQQANNSDSSEAVNQAYGAQAELEYRLR